MTLNLLDKLRTRQKDLKLTDEEFAARLGISRPLWHLTKTGKQDVSERVMRGIVRAFPDLQVDVLLFLQPEVSRLTVYDNQVTDDDPVEAIAGA